jgi:hypothetical protein
MEEWNIRFFCLVLFSEKIQFNGEKYQTNYYNKVLEWIFQNSNELKSIKTED